MLKFSCTMFKFSFKYMNRETFEAIKSDVSNLGQPIN